MARCKNSNVWKISQSGVQHLFPPVISNAVSTKISDEDHQVKTNINFKTGQKQKCFINIDPSSEGSSRALRGRQAR